MDTAARGRRVSAAAALLAGLTLAVVTALTGAGVARSAGDAVASIDVLSNRADLVSGGDALVAIGLAAGVDPATVEVRLNGTDISSTFAVRQNGSFSGLVTGLEVGENTLIARGPAGQGRVLTITNQPIGGPVFAGPQVTPYYCNPNASNPPLGAATDAQCNAPTRVDLLYRNLSNQFVAYDPANPPAPSAIQTASFDGKTVPFIVQRVTGTADRGIYQIAVIVDPAKPIEPWSTDQPWSHKVFYPYGGACGTQHNQTGPSSALQATQLAAGFAVATSSLNIYANDCNDVISAEATMMVKEIVVERYGKIRYTMGNGGSAASMQQHLIATNYPGLLDGLTTSQVFPDHMDQVMGSLDCRLLMHYFWPTAALQGGPITVPPNALFPTAASRLPVWGSNPANGDNLCGQKVNLFGADRTELVPGSNVFCGLQTVDLWSLANPTGERCGIFDFMRAVFGAVPAPDATKGRGRSATDNVGVQYGLKALQAGQITPAQFVDLNSKVGGIDIDGNFTPHRKAADPVALQIMYDTGRMNDGSGMKDLPEIDDRTGAQMDDTGFHPAMESFAYRARLDKTNGQHDTEVLRLARPGVTGFPTQFNLMRDWLDNLTADTSGDPQSVKVRRAKPAGLQDGCYTSAGFLAGDFTCGGIWQYYGTPRQVAGGPLASDVMKCQLKPLVRSDYSVTFTDDEWATLQANFPEGVCDYSKPGVAQQGPKATWLTFANGPGGEPLGPAPASRNGADELAGLQETIEGMNLDKPLSKDLLKKIDDALKELDKGHLKQACDHVDDLVVKSIDEVGRNKPRLLVAQAEEIVGDAYLAEQLLGCIELDSTLPASVQSVLDVIDAINGLDISAGTENDLTTKAKEAGKKLAQDKKNATKDACKKLDELDASAAKKLTESQYAGLLPAVQAARSTIGC